MFIGKCVLKIWNKFTREYPCQSVISIKLQSNFAEITLQHVCSPVNLLHIFRTAFPTSTFPTFPLSLSAFPTTFGGLLLSLPKYIKLSLTNRFNQIQYVCCDNYFRMFTMIKCVSESKTSSWKRWQTRNIDYFSRYTCSIPSWLHHVVPNDRYVYKQMDHHCHLGNH